MSKPESKPEPILICKPATLPDGLKIEAADQAGWINHLNRPQMAPGTPLPTPARLAAMTGKFWQAGQTLTWCFLDGADAETRRQMAAVYARWAQYVNLVFQETQDASGAHFRWSREHEGYWSYIGTDCGMVPAGKPTGCLENFTRYTPQSEWFRVGDHETGHGLGFGHTQLLPEIVERIDPEAAYRFFGAPPNSWPRTVTKANVLQPYRPGEVQLANVQLTSVMMYGLPAEIIKDHIAILGGSGITPEDGATAAKIYPGKVPVVPPPKPGGPPVLEIGVPVQGQIDFAGERDQYVLKVAKAGTYTIDTEPNMEMGLYPADGGGRVLGRGYLANPKIKLKKGAYLLKIMHHLSRGMGPYTVTVSKAG